jgi:hypothetical protein
MTNPAVVEKQLVDIELKSGINQAERAELLDWVKSLTNVENLVPDNSALKRRPGAVNYFGDGTTCNNRRFINIQDGLGMVDTSNQLTTVIEGAGTTRTHGSLADFSVSSKAIGSLSDPDMAVFVPTVLSTYSSAPSAVGVTADYEVAMFPHSTYAGSPSDYVIVIKDRESGNIVRRYQIGETCSYECEWMRATFCIVAARYIHVYYNTLSAEDHCRFFQIDTQSLPTSLSGTSTVALAIAAGNRIAGCCVSSDHNYSYVITENASGGTSLLQKFNTSGASVGSLSLVNWRATGIASSENGSEYLAGYTTTAAYQIKKITNLTVTSTHSSAIAIPAAGVEPTPRISVDETGNCYYTAFENVTYGSNVMAACRVMYMANGGSLTNVGLIPGWNEMSTPVCFDVDHHYMVLGKNPSQAGTTASREDLGAMVVINLADYDSGLGGGTAVRWRPVAVLDDYVGLTATSYSKGACYTIPHTPHVEWYWDAEEESYARSYNMYCITGHKATATSVSYNIHRLNYLDVTDIYSANGLISGGVMQSFDGDELGELGFVDMPAIGASDSGSGTLAAGTRAYVAVFEYTDSAGNTHLSRVSPICSFTGNGTGTSIQVSWCAISQHFSDSVLSSGSVARYTKVNARIYRTVNGGNQYYLLTTIRACNSSQALFDTYADTVSDATLASRPVMYRHPGSLGTALDRYYAPASRCMTRHKDRVFVAKGSNVYFSSYAVDREAPWFNPAFYINVPGGTGDITALATMDGRLVVFKRDGIWVIDGDGPPENGGSGTEFSVPARILTEFGCITQRSVVVTPDGIMYRSTRGIEMLTRGLQVVWIGERVSDDVDSMPFTNGSCFDRINGRVIFSLSEDGTTDADTVQAGVGGTPCRFLSLDIKTGSWSKWNLRFTNVAYDVAFAKVSYGSKTDNVFLQTNKLMVLDESVGYDTNDHATYTVETGVIETGWVKIKSNQERIRVSDLLVLAKYLSNHDVKISVAYDYSDTYEHSATWTPAMMEDWELEQIEFQVPRQAVMAARFKIEIMTPTDPTNYPIGDGRGAEILGLSVRLGPRGGGAKVSAGQKG